MKGYGGFPGMAMLRGTACSIGFAWAIWSETVLTLRLYIIDKMPDSGNMVQDCGAIRQGGIKADSYAAHKIIRCSVQVVGGEMALPYFIW